jgi:hypothetical protein
MLSALITSPLILLAIFIAKFDLPDAVGPEIKIILDCLSIINLA